MGFLDRLFGRRAPQQGGYQQTFPQQGYGQPQQTGYQQTGYEQSGYQQGGYQQGAPQGQPQARTQDEQAIARYRYLLRTAPPEAIEQAHAEAFAQLTPQQRQQVLAEMSKDLPVGERPQSDDAQSLARAATRAELRRPGYMERAFGGYGGGMGGGMMGGGMMGGMGGMFMGSMLGSIAGMVVGTAIADSMMDGFDHWDQATDGGMNDGGFDGQIVHPNEGDQGDAQSFDGSGDQGYDAAGDQGYDAGQDGGFDMGGGDGGFGGDTFGGFDGGGFDGGGFDMGGGDFGGDF